MKLLDIFKGTKMKLSEKVEIKCLNDEVKEVRGTSIEYSKNGIELSLIVHESLEAWETKMLKISEKTTGLGMCVIKEIPMNKVTKEDVIKAVDDFIEVHTIEKIREVMANSHTIEELKVLTNN